MSMHGSTASSTPDEQAAGAEARDISRNSDTRGPPYQAHPKHKKVDRSDELKLN